MSESWFFRLYVCFQFRFYEAVSYIFYRKLQLKCVYGTNLPQKRCDSPTSLFGSRLTCGIHHLSLMGKTVRRCSSSNALDVRSHRHLFCHAPLGVCSAKCRQQSPQWTILSHVNCLIQGEVVGLQILLDSLHPRSTRASRWSAGVKKLWVWGLAPLGSTN